ncbi:hypothetical protein EON63_03380 [archaeon]|nr:MAG: hypothetical protein EON63_03380 [archaeon]
MLVANCCVVGFLKQFTPYMHVIHSTHRSPHNIPTHSIVKLMPNTIHNPHTPYILNHSPCIIDHTIHHTLYIIFL